MTRIKFILLTAALLPLSAVAKPPRQAVKDVIRPLPDGCVRLTNFFENDILNNELHWNKGVLPYKGLVEFFRKGRPKFAVGEMWGKAVRSGAMYYRYTRDPELRRILQATMKDLLTTVRSNGSISCTPVEEQPGSSGGDLWERKYVLLAMTQYYRHVDRDPAVLKAMTDEANSILCQVGDPPKADITQQGWSHNGIESSCLLEPMMRLYQITGDGRYLDFARYIIRKGGCRGADIFRQAADNVPPHEMASGYPKAYEMLSVFEGLAEYYRMTGDTAARRPILNLFHNVKEREITIIGNGGGDQPYYPQWCGEAWDDTRFQQTNPKMERMMETCVGVTWMKYCTQVLRLTGDAAAADCIERYAYNGLIGAMKPSGDGFSYVNLLNGHKVTNTGWGTTVDGLPVTCCNLNGPLGLAYIPYIEVMQADTGPVVNLWNAASVTASTAKGNPVSFDILTQFPYSDKVTVVMRKLRAEPFTMTLRIPSWCGAGASVSVNGRTAGKLTPGEYFPISRTWHEGDVIGLDFDMCCRIVTSPPNSETLAGSRVALQYGPMVLARDEHADTTFDRPVSIKADSNGEVTVKPVKPTLPGTRMEFLVPTDDGYIRMSDYASVNGWDGKRICTWMPVKK